MIRLIFLYMFLQLSNYCLCQDSTVKITQFDYRKPLELTGQLGKKFGTMVTVEGKIVQGFTMESYRAPNLLVQKINDSCIQEVLMIPLAPRLGSLVDRHEPQIEIALSYRLRVYETGGFDGIPDDAYQEYGSILQTTGFHFRTELVVISVKKIAPIVWSPENFRGRNALLSGIAKNNHDTALITTAKWTIRLTGCRKWSDAELGKLVEVYGKIEPTETAAIYKVANSETRLVKLSDQVGKTVKLRGRAFSLNNYWWFNYRGIDIYVEKMDSLPNWTTDNHARSLEISGVLEQAILPRIDQISIKSKRDRKRYYIVRKASWALLDELLAPEYNFDSK